MNRLGYRVYSLLPVSTNVSSASNVKIDILGGIILNVRETNRVTGVSINCKQLFYVSGVEGGDDHAAGDQILPGRSSDPRLVQFGSCGRGGPLPGNERVQGLHRVLD